MPPRATRISAVVAVVAVAAGGAAAPAIDVPGELQVDNPRAYGPFIGDLVTRHLEVTVPAPYALATKQLPAAGRVGAWLELDAASVRSDASPHGNRFRIDLRYQIVNSPPHPLFAVLPPITLWFDGVAGRVQRGAPAWPVSIAPLVADASRTGPRILRPARAPQLMNATETRRRALLCAAAAATLLAWPAAQWLGRARRRGPFAAARRTLHRLASSSSGGEALPAALRVVHRAFDQTMGVRVFAGQLEDFIAHHPQFHDARASMQQFFELSRTEFFGGAAHTAQGLDELQVLCVQLERCEQRSARAGHAAL